MRHFKPRFFALLLLVSLVFQIFSPAKAEAFTSAANLVTRPTGRYFSETPASFQEVTFDVRDDVVQVDRQLGSAFQSKLKLYDELTKPNYETDISGQDKLKLQAMIKKSDFSSVYSGYAKGTILFDKTNNLAVKVVDDTPLGGSTSTSDNYVTLSSPQIHEVLSDFRIPMQSVKLTRGNITGFELGVEESVDTGKKKDKDSILSDNPYIKLDFGSGKPLIAYDECGVKFIVKVSGHFGIDSITADGYYSFSDGYKLVLKTAEELKLKVSCQTALKEGKKICIPLFGISIPAGIGEVTGGVVLVVGADGSMELKATAHQWIKAEAGLEGGTYLGIPSSINPHKKIDSDFDVDVGFEGKINGYVKAGPILDIKIIGKNVAGAGVFVGLGAKCQYESGDKLTADIYGLLEVYASVLGKKKTLADEKYVLYQLEKQNTGNYVISFNEACMYRNTVWGNIKLLGAGTAVTGPAVVTVENRYGTRTDIDVNCDANGNFNTNVLLDKGLRLAKDDKIYITSVNGQSLTSDAITPTFPFKEVVIEYTDFFNDSSTGYVLPAKVMNWDTNKSEYIYYTGDINYSIQMPPTPGANQAVLKDAPNKPVLKTVRCDSKGNFRLDYDFKPNDEVAASLNANGVIVKSQTVKPDTDIYVKALTEMTRKDYTENGRQIEQMKETDHILLYNFRGTKSVDLTGTFTIDYSLYHSPLCSIIDMTTGHTLLPPNQLKTLELSQKIAPIYAFKFKSITIPGKTGSTTPAIPVATGTSMASREFVTEWGWKSDDTQPNIVLNVPADEETVTFRYDVYEQKPEADQEKTLRKGVKYLLRTGTLAVVYEGAVIAKIDVMRDFEYDYVNSNRITGLDPVARELINRVQSHINPAVMENIKQRIGRSVIPAR